jgi:hypothetical protein
MTSICLSLVEIQIVLNVLKEVVLATVKLLIKVYSKIKKPPPVVGKI